MNKDVWYRMFKQWIDSAKAIDTLRKNGVIDEDDMPDLKMKLLSDIIETLEGEIEE